MMPPIAPEDGPVATGDASSAALPCPPYPLETLRKRPDFLRAARARRQAMPGLVLQARKRGAQEPPGPQIRIGYTASKKVGNAVARNRAKRRLRALAREILPIAGTPGWDYVLIARAGETATRRFEYLRADLASALEKIHKPARGRPGTK